VLVTVDRGEGGARAAGRDQLVVEQRGEQVVWAEIVRA